MINFLKKSKKLFGKDTGTQENRAPKEMIKKIENRVEFILFSHIRLVVGGCGQVEK